jgi:hypothetical protein
MIGMASYRRVSTIMMAPDPLQLGMMQWRFNRTGKRSWVLVFMDEPFKKV